MFEWFLNPGFMIAGGALVSAPIIIHLINRMRFKRIRWAAMEFLLKSQKRNRRRLIIEQLILLLLRILIVLFLGFLLARFVLGAQNAGQSTLHILVLDDSLSMTDHWNKSGTPTTSFAVAKDSIRKVAKESKQANSIQQMQVFLLSDIEANMDCDPIFDQRLGDDSLKALDTKLDSLEPTGLHLKPINALKKAKMVFDASAYNKRIVHIASDMRDNDWVVGPDAKELNEEVDRQLDAGVNITLLDGGYPTRPQEGSVVA